VGFRDKLQGGLRDPASTDALHIVYDRGSMPLRTASSRSAQLEKAFEAVFYCRACSTWRLRRAPTPGRRDPTSKRFASTLVSATAVNATKSIPTKNRDLHQALNELGRKATGQVSLSRLRLAIQGLESERPTVRIALLGLNASSIACRLTRLLLADSSRPQQAWETKLLAEDGGQRQGLVVRFGHPPNEALQPPRSALPVLYIPAPMLQNQAIEILISSIEARDTTANSVADIPSDVFLSPTIGTPASAGGRQSLISQPVHCTFIVAHGVHELVTAAKLLARTKFPSDTEKRLVDIILNLDGKVETSPSKSMIVDVAKAEEGLQAVRDDLARAAAYGSAWRESGMPALSKAIATSSTGSNESLSPLLRNLIASLLETTAANIASQAKEAEVITRSKAMTPETRLSLEKAISTFLQQGHAELQGGLAAAWSSRNWRKLAFWKLFWRVDDVPLIFSDLITTAWLPRTERAVYELTGRLKQAGVSLPLYAASNASSTRQSPVVPIQANVSELTPAKVNEHVLVASATSTESISRPLLLPPPRPSIPNQATTTPQPNPSLATTISTSRTTIISSLTSNLTASAQQTVLRALTTTALSFTLSALSFLHSSSSSFPNSSIYDSAAIAAFGTAWALRRMQRDWERQCSGLERGLMEEGRSVLKQTEGLMRRSVVEASRTRSGDGVELRMRREAAEVLARARLALEERV